MSSHQHISKADLLLKLAKERPLLLARELRAAGISHSTLSTAMASGLIVRVSRGVYRHVDATWDEHLHLSEVAARVPKAVIVLMSALNFHQIGTHQAQAVWIQLKQNAVTPRIDYPAIEVIRTRNDWAFTEGVEIHNLNGIAVAITNPARTVADCFKHRNKIGLDLCLEALRDAFQAGMKTSEILAYARLNRVENILIPYLQTLSCYLQDSA